MKNQGQIDAWTQEANQATQEGDHNFAYPATQLEIIGAIDLINYASDRLWASPQRSEPAPRQTVSQWNKLRSGISHPGCRGGLGQQVHLEIRLPILSHHHVAA